MTLQMSPYLSFNGDCESAFRCYAATLDGTMGELFRYGGSPMDVDVPPDWAGKIMHGSVTIGGQVLMGADVAPNRYEAPKGFSLSLHMTDVARGERIFRELANGGSIVMPFERTFWAERFGAVVDRFGIPWTINCGEPDPSSETTR
jgi:PhnB protein